MAHVKTAVSLPEELYKRLDAIACERHTSRSKILAEALADYVAHLESEEITRRYNELYSNLTPEEIEEDKALLHVAQAEMARILEREGERW